MKLDLKSIARMGASTGAMMSPRWPLSQLRCILCPAFKCPMIGSTLFLRFIHRFVALLWRFCPVIITSICWPKYAAR